MLCRLRFCASCTWARLLCERAREGIAGTGSVGSAGLSRTLLSELVEADLRTVLPLGAGK